jgi:hypothetical protein
METRNGATLWEGAPSIVYVACPSEHLAEAKVFQTSGSDSRGPILWSATNSDPGGGTGLVKIGGTSEGWTTIMELAEPLDEPVVAEVVTDDEIATSFLLDPTQLRAGQVFDGAVNTPSDEFRREALETCPD